jgi:hypothetical protein
MMLFGGIGKPHGRTHSEMPADGLTKVLSRQKFAHFCAFLSLQDVRRLRKTGKGKTSLKKKSKTPNPQARQTDMSLCPSGG